MTMKKLERLSSALYFGVMLSCGLMISWQARNQEAHATPRAIFIACAASSILSACLGWRFAKCYLSKNKFSATVVPLTILLATASSAAIIYAAIEPLIRPSDYFPAVVEGIRSVPQYLFFYVLSSGVVWALGLPLATLVLRGMARNIEGT